MLFDKTLLNRLVDTKVRDTGLNKSKICLALAKLCDIKDTKTIERWLNVKNPLRPSPARVKKFAKFFKCTVGQLNGDGTHKWSGKRDPVSVKKAETAIRAIMEALGLSNTFRMDNGSIIFSGVLLLSGLMFGLTGHPIVAAIMTTAGFLIGLAGLMITKASKWRYAVTLLGATTATAAAIAIKSHRDAQKAVRSTPPPATQPVAAKPEPKRENQPEPKSDRQAAEYLKDIGGKGEVKDKDGKIVSLDNLPAEGVVLLTKVILLENKKVDDAGLAHFKDCRDLEHLELDVTNVSDAGMVAFNGIKSLKHLSLGQTKVTDAGLGNFRDCKDLTYLGLFGLDVSDAGFKLFRGCKNLRFLQLGKTKLTGEGLSICAGFGDLEGIDVGGTASVGDEGVVYLKECARLKNVGLSGTGVTDKGLSSLKDGKNLEEIALAFTRVTNNGLLHLRELKNLRRLDLKGSKVTAEGIADLRMSLPQCAIEGP